MAKASFGDWLKLTRTRLGISQTEIMERAGFDRSHISKIERGRIALPEQPTRERIHAVLGTSDQDLVVAGVLQVHGVIRDGVPTNVYYSIDDPTIEVGADSSPRPPIRFLVTNDSQADIIALVNQIDWSDEKTFGAIRNTLLYWVDAQSREDGS